MVWRATTKSPQLRERMELSIFQVPVTDENSAAPTEGEVVELELVGGNRTQFTITRYDDFEAEIAFEGHDRWVIRSTASRTLDSPPELPVDAAATHWIVVQHIGHESAADRRPIV